MAESLTILYTQNLRGNFNLAAHLGRWLRDLRTQYAAGMRTLLLDLGNASDPTSWHHQLTVGRSTLFVLDAMGYHAINASGTIEGTLAPALREAYRLAILSPESDWWDERGEFKVHCIVSELPHQSEESALGISLTPASETQLASGFLRLSHLPAGSVGRVQLRLEENNAEMVEQEEHPLPDDILPEPSISATVDFVLSEAYQLANRHRISP